MRVGLHVLAVRAEPESILDITDALAVRLLVIHRGSGVPCKTESYQRFKLEQAKTPMFSAPVYQGSIKSRTEEKIGNTARLCSKLWRRNSFGSLNRLLTRAAQCEVRTPAAEPRA